MSQPTPPPGPPVPGPDGDHGRRSVRIAMISLVVSSVLTVIGFVACVAGYTEQPAVVDGASRLFVDAFGDAGRHSRSAIGVAALPRGGAVEIEVEIALG